VTELDELPSPVMSSATRFERDGATRLRREEIQQLCSANPPTEHRSTTLIRPVNVKNVLGDIQTDCDNL
jgi:hypothetical protein